MSFLSALFSCTDQAVDINGPNHKSGKKTVIHIDKTVQIEYTLPGGISKQFGFDSAREQEARTKYIDLSSLQEDDFEQTKWLDKKFIDAGRWEYLGPKNKGLSGELAWLNLTLLLNKVNLKGFTEAEIKRDIKDSFLSHIEAENKEIRSHYPSYSEDNLAHVLISPPKSFEWLDINTSRMLTWLSNEVKGAPSRYYILPLSQHYAVSIIISHHISVNDDKLRELITQRIQDDTALILESFVISKK
ncbi:hypothetical protein [Agaribacterium sp. ZY112]|uniref:hypothetical protein n=1 Tax=Agaribacterium sp. ZY112 TaxID=3233574 RepID=UPI003525C7D3